MSSPEPRRATCPCGRSFVADADCPGIVECDECREYARASIATMLPTPGLWSRPRAGCDLPRKGPWHEDDDEGGGVA